MIDPNDSAVVIEERWRVQPTMASNTLQISIDKIDLYRAADAQMANEAAMHKLHNAILRDTPGCAGCQNLKVERAEDLMRMADRIVVRCKHYGMVNIRCPDGTTLARRGDEYGVLSFEATGPATMPPGNESWLDTIPERQVIVERPNLIQRSPDQPTTASDAW